MIYDHIKDDHKMKLAPPPLDERGMTRLTSAQELTC